MHRDDVDGLRAIAVLAILAFHLDLVGFDAGFVGVDIFFVISGYVITRGILRDLAAQRFSLAQFYLRRARRILPAMMVVLAAALAAGVAMLSPRELDELSDSALATLVFGANFFFHDRTNYFADTAHQRPLIHMWSLGVEEQFYILFPLLILAVWRYWRAGLGKVLLGIVALSFIYLVVAHSISEKNAFYMPMARFWELAAGASVAAAEAHWRLPLKVSRALAAIGLFGIVASVGFVDGATMAGWMLALPVLATVAVIAAGSNAGAVSRVLASRPFVAFGLLSYSTYLIHWPPIVFWRMHVGRQLRPLEQAAIVVLTLLLAAVLWRFVEMPVRTGRSSIANKPAVIGIVASVLAVAAVAAGCRWQAEADWRLNAQARESIVLLRTAIAERPRCVADPSWISTVSAGTGVCRWNADARGTAFVVWGDSHAGAMAPEISRVLALQGASGLTVAMPRCPPLQGVHILGRKSNKDCRAFVDAVIDAIQRDRPKVVVLAGRWATLASDVRSPGDGEVSGQIADLDTGRRMGLGEALSRTLDLLGLNGSRLILVGPVPEIDFDVPSTLVRSLRGIGDLPPVMRSEFEIRQKQVMQALARIAESGKATVVYPHAALCNAQVCSVADGTRPLYIDDDHLSPFGAAKVARLVEQVIGQ